MFIDYEIYKWLSSLNLISESSISFVRHNETVKLTPQTANKILNGTIFIKITKILKKRAQASFGNIAHTPPNLNLLKDDNTRLSRGYNWNILTEALAASNYHLDKNTKALILEGDITAAIEVLRDIHGMLMKSTKV